jgi:hypothetical protein
MKTLAPYVLCCALLTAAPLAAKDTQPVFNTIVVNHFTNSNGTNRSQEYINSFCESMRNQLQKHKLANQVLEEGITVASDAAANSIVIEGRFTDFVKGVFFKPGTMSAEISIYRISDHALVKTMMAKGAFPPGISNKDGKTGELTGSQVASEIRQSMKNISLSSIAPAPPRANQASTGGNGTAQAGPEALASVQLSSEPAGAEITVDGNYVGSTPSLIKLRLGTHSVKMTKNGYAPWVRSIEVQVGETRNLAAELEKAAQ